MKKLFLILTLLTAFSCTKDVSYDYIAFFIAIKHDIISQNLSGSEFYSMTNGFDIAIMVNDAKQKNNEQKLFVHGGK